MTLEPPHGHAVVLLDRDLLRRAALAAGCNGCLVFTHPSELVSVLRACVLGDLA